MSTQQSADGNPHDALVQSLGITPLKGRLEPLKTKGEIRASNELSTSLHLQKNPSFHTLRLTISQSPSTSSSSPPAPPTPSSPPSAPPSLRPPTQSTSNTSAASSSRPSCPPPPSPSSTPTASPHHPRSARRACSLSARRPRSPPPSSKACWRASRHSKTRGMRDERSR